MSCQLNLASMILAFCLWQKENNLKEDSKHRLYAVYVIPDHYEPVKQYLLLI